MSLSPLSRQLDNSNWNTGRNFTITAVNDTVPEVDESGTITHNATSNVSGSVLNGIVACATMFVNVYDNDGATPTYTRTPTRTPTPTYTPTATGEVCGSSLGERTLEPLCQVIATFTPTPTVTPIVYVCRVSPNQGVIIGGYATVEDAVSRLTTPPPPISFSETDVLRVAGRASLYENVVRVERESTPGTWY